MILQFLEAGPDKIPRFRMVANNGEPMRVSGFSAPVVVDFTGLSFNQKIPIRLEHSPEKGIGHTTLIKIEAGKLYAEGLISRKTPFSVDVTAAGLAGYPWQASIGGPVIEAENLVAGQTGTANGKTFSGPVTIVRKMELREISFVEQGADSKTSAIIEGKENEMQEKNNDRKEREKMAIEAEKFDNEKANEIKAELEDLKKSVELLAVRSGRPKTPELYLESRGADFAPLFETALLLNAGIDGKTLETFGYSPQTIDEATRREYRGETLQSVVRRQAGDTTGRFSDGTIKAAFDNSRISAGTAQGAFSTLSLPGLLSNVANKILDLGYSEIEDPTAKLSKDISVKDFKEASLYTLLMSGEIGRYAEGGELEHIGLKETGKTASTETRGAMLVLTREMIINDDLGAFGDLFRLFGRKVNLTRQKVWFDTLISNRSKFTKVTGNPAFNFESLSTAFSIFDTAKDETGDFIALGGRFLLVPPALHTKALIIEKSTTLDHVEDNVVRAPVPDTIMTGTVNPFYSAFKTVYSPYFGAASPVKNGSDTHYILLSAPNMAAVMGSVWLNGIKHPYLETGELNFNTLGIGYRCYFDYKPVFLSGVGAVYSAGTGAN
ncbi:MAG: hypothetical protein Q4G68_11365 [Planctomycetia bacterium]|nr:hypothetical protein [Planctomycetia bacterium]